MVNQPKKQKPKTAERLVCQNKKASHLYFIEDTSEAGLALKGTEVKSLRSGRGSLQEAYVRVRDGEVWIEGFHIPPYDQGNIHNADPVRVRKLLLHRREIDKLEQLCSRRGYTIVPLKVYFSHGKAKVLIGVARGKKAHDKRDAIRDRDQKRDLDRAMKQNR
jgi:SsrA-binding protein